MKTKTLILTAVFGLVFAACNQASPAADTAPDAANVDQTVPAGDAAANPAADDTDSMVDEDMMAEEAGDQMAADYTLDMTNFAYSVTEMSAAPGETLTVLLNSEEGFHDLVIDELNVASEQINAGDQTTVEITIPEDAESGTTYEYYCSVGNHRAMGMVGTLTVE